MELNWRRWEVEKFRYTYVTKTITYGDNTFSEKFVVPYGAKETFKKAKSDSRGKYSLSKETKGALLLPEHYDANDIVIEAEDQGDLGFEEFYVVYCTKCHISNSGFMKYFINTYKDLLPSDPKIADIVDNWDKIVEKYPKENKHCDILGCILPNVPTVNASPNDRHYIIRPVEHTESKCHRFTLLSPSTSSQSGAAGTSSELGAAVGSSSKKRKEITSPVAVKKQKALTVSVDGTVTAEKTFKVLDKKKKQTGGKGDVTITVKHQKQLTFKSINRLIDPTVPLTKIPSDVMEKDAQNACFSFVLSGCAKEVNNSSTIEFYNKHVSHLRKCHHEKLGHLEFDNRVIPQPLRATLDKNNIKEVHRSLVDSYKQLESSSENKLMYKPFRVSNIYSIYTDGIQKFNRELNGSYARTVDEDLSVTNAPVSLHEIEGGSMNKEKLSVELISVINEIKPITQHESAFACFVRDNGLAVAGLAQGPVTPPEFFECCTIKSHDNENKKLELSFPNWPVCVTADGCSTNSSAINLLVDSISILSPDARCSAHACHGSERRLATSKTMCVQEVVDYATQIRPVSKHFKNSGKSHSLLNDAIKQLQMKPIRAMTWCPTRMGNLLTSSKRSTELLVPLSDVLASCNIKKEEATYFMSPKCLGIMHTLADVEKVFMKGFIRRLDGDNSLIIDVFHASAEAIKALEELKLAIFDSYINGLSEDESGNIHLSTKTPTGEVHDLQLNYTHHPGRRSGESKVDKIKRVAVELKDTILDNLKSNIQLQNQADTIVEFTSCFHMKRILSCEERIDLLKKLYQIYRVDYTHPS